MKIFLYITLVFFLVSCKNDINEVRALDKKHDLNVETGTMINAYMSTGGKVKAHLTAPYMIRSTSDSNMTEFPKTLTVFLYDDSVRVNTHIFAKYGRYIQRKSLIYLRDSVVIYNTAKDTLRTSELFWDQNSQRMYTTKEVWVHKYFPEDYIDALDGMETSSNNLNNYTFYNPRYGSFMSYSEASLTPGSMDTKK
jgi:LPS export ABC transporter protein LptC